MRTHDKPSSPPERRDIVPDCSGSGPAAKERRAPRRILRGALLFAALLTLPLPAFSSQEGQDLTELSLEELMDVEITSVSRLPERRFRAAAAVHVVTGEEIERAGVTRLAEALRLVPGVHVARINASEYAVGIRGFNGLFANKLLVLVDGRSIYTPLFSGVFWDTADLPIDDIEQIEVIRGPGATLWGANAVNGVINIITKHAADTQGAYVRLGAGTEEQALATARYGGRIGPNAHFRVYGKLLDGDGFVDADGEPTPDEWRLSHGGFRVDWSPSASDDLSLTGSLAANRTTTRFTIPALRPPFETTFDDDAGLAGGHLLASWDHRFSSDSRSTLSASYTRTDRDEALLGHERDTVDLDLQHELRLRESHQLVWGVGYRLTSDDLRSSFAVSFEDEQRTDHLLSGFVQDQVSLLDGELELTLGSKLEHNSYTGFEAQPGVRLMWAAAPHHTLWGAVTRAVRTPSRAEATVAVALDALVAPRNPLPLFPVAFGSEDFRSEELVAWEVGYRARFADRLAFDASGFVNRYDDLRTTTPAGQPFLRLRPSPHLVLPLEVTNEMRGTTYGLELHAGAQPTAR